MDLTLSIQYFNFGASGRTIKNIKSDINYLVVYLKCKQELFQERRARNKTDGNGIITTPFAYLLSVSVLFG